MLEDEGGRGGGRERGGRGEGIVKKINHFEQNIYIVCLCVQLSYAKIVHYENECSCLRPSSMNMI